MWAFLGSIIGIFVDKETQEIYENIKTAAKWKMHKLCRISKKSLERELLSVLASQ